ncbi:MAG: carboxypeptidase regulatory-like domain-containing protein, partial [Thermoplasmata archaeon]|nr:carboxypeptidase regulatory-like domain-containing protein [Thermoplasmata archaeon]
MKKMTSSKKSSDFRNYLAIALVFLMLGAALVAFTTPAMGDSSTKIYGYVREKGSNDPIVNATITISCNENETYTTYTGRDGYYDQQVEGDRNYTVTAEKEGYKSQTKYVYVKDGEEKQVDFYLEKEGGEKTILKGYTKEKDGGDHIPYVDITITKGNYSKTTQSNSDGYYKVELPEGGTYHVRAEKDGYKDYGANVTVREGEENIHHIRMEKEGGSTTKIYGYVKDKDTKDPINDAKVTISYERESYTVYTDRNGYYDQEVEGDRNYSVKAEKDGYKSQTKYVYVEKGNEEQVDFYLEKEGGGKTILKGYTKEKTNGTHIPCVDITVSKENFSKTTQSDRDGFYKFELPEGGQYEIRAKKDGYKDYAANVTVREGEENIHHIRMEKEGGGTTRIHGYVKEKDTKDPINDAKVTISYERESYTTYTNRNGSYDQEVEGDRNYSVKAEKDGYESQTEHVYVDKGEEARVDFYLDKEGGNQTTIYGYVKDKDTEDPINDAEVTITGQECNCSYTVYTDREGYYGQEIDLAGNYTVIAEKDGYKSQTKDVYVKDGEEKRVDFYLEKEGGNRTILNGYTKRQETGKHIPDVEVTISKGNFSKTQYSDDNGWYEFELDEGGGYKILAKKENYDDYLINISIREGEEETHHIRMEGGKKTTLDGYVTDADTGEGINDVYILIYTTGHDDGIETYSGENGYYYWERDYGGNCTLVAEKDGYEYYKDKDSIYLEEEKSHVYNFTMTKEGGRKAWITGYVKDKAANDPLNDAKIRITGHECNCSYTVYTDGNGHYEQKIDLAGNYTVQAEKDGYESQTKDVYVGEGEEKRVNFSLEKEGGKALP